MFAWFGGPSPKPKVPMPEWPTDAVTKQTMVEIVSTTFKNRERRIIDQAARYAADVAVERMIEYLRGKRVLDFMPLHITEGYD